MTDIITYKCKICKYEFFAPSEPVKYNCPDCGAQNSLRKKI